MNRRDQTVQDRTRGRSTFIDVREIRKITGSLFIALATCVVSVCPLVAQTATTGAVVGIVVVTDSSGSSVVPGATVALTGKETLSAVTDQTGNYRFPSVAPGTYKISATAPGLEAAQTVEVAAGTSLQLPLELKPTGVKTEVEVSDTYQGVKTAAPSEVVEQKIIQSAPNLNDRFESVLPLVPGVVRGPDGRLNLKGARGNQNGALVNSANVTDPATGNLAINLPIDVVSLVQVISNPYDPQYGKMTGAVSSVETKTGNFEKFHFTLQNVLPRARLRNGSIVGVGGATPRLTFSGPIKKDRIAFMQSVEYRFVRTPVNSLPAMNRDTKLEGFNSYTQVDLNLTPKQTATVSLAVYPQKLNYLGLNTFTPQPSTGDLHQRGYQVYGQHRYITGPDSILTSQFSYKVFDVDVTAQNDDPFELWIDTTAGGFFNRQARRTTRSDWQETYQLPSRQLFGTHQLRAGFDFAHSSFDGRETFRPVTLIGRNSLAVERVSFSSPTSFFTDQNEASFFISDQWAPNHRLSISPGLRLDHDTITDATHAAPRVGILLALTSDGRTLLKGGVGMFYDRVPLTFARFEEMPFRTVSMLGAGGATLSSTPYINRTAGSLENPRSTSWNVALERRVLEKLNMRVAYEQRNTTKDFVLSPVTTAQPAIELSNGGHDSYREFQVAGRYEASRYSVNASYVRSRARGDLNDPFLFLGNFPQAVIQPNQRGRLSFDAPNRFLFWGEINAPWKLTLLPVYDLHTGFPYSVQDEYRNYIGPRNTKRYPWFESCDLQVLRPVSIPLRGKRIRARAGVSVFNLFNHFNPRDVQNNIASSNFGQFYNDAWREFRGKFVVEF